MTMTIADASRRGIRHDGGVPTYVAFLRAINLGPNRKFPNEAIRRAVEGVGFTDVETHINTGNVRFTTSLRSRGKMSACPLFRTRSDWLTSRRPTPTASPSPTSTVP